MAISDGLGGLCLWPSVGTICAPMASILAKETTFRPALAATADASGVTPSTKIMEWKLGQVPEDLASHKRPNSRREHTTQERPVCSRIKRTVSGPSVS